MAGLLILLFFLLLCTLLQSAFSLPLPGSILGMLLLLISLILRGKIPEHLASISQILAPLLPLFIIPVSVGVVTQKALLQEHGLLLLGILAVSLIPGALLCAWIMKGGKAGL